MKVHPTARTPVLAQAINKDFFLGSSGGGCFVAMRQQQLLQRQTTPQKKENRTAARRRQPGNLIIVIVLQHHPFQEVINALLAMCQVSLPKTWRGAENRPKERSSGIRAGWVPFGCG